MRQPGTKYRSHADLAWIDVPPPASQFTAFYVVSEAVDQAGGRLPWFQERRLGESLLVA